VRRRDLGVTGLAVIALAVMLAAGLAIRLALLDAPGHYGDSVVMSRWAENMAAYGPWNFYDHDGAIYPALLYVYWPLGVLLNGADLARAIKGVSIPFDLATGVVLYLAARRLTGLRWALLAPALYLFNPAVLLAGPVWGQVDAAGTLAYLLALLALAGRRFGWAGALGVVALMTKPQFGLVLLPIAVVIAMRWRETQSRQPLLRTVGGALAAYLLIAIPLRLDPISYLGKVAGAGSYKDVASANAANLWGLLIGYKIPDGALVYVGGALLLAGLAAAMLPLRQHRDLPAILAVGLFVIFAFYFLPTRVHERYLFPALAVLAPLAVANWRVLVTYLLLTAGFAASMLYALVDTTPFRFWPWLDDLVTLPSARIWISLTLMATAATVVAMLLFWRRPAPTGGAAGPP
jgi:dolichyl-phosphate-mannose-protein mannosyltransferase